MATVKEINNILRGKTLNWRITKEGYRPSVGNRVILDNSPIYIEMREEGDPIDVSDYEYTENNKIVTLTKYIGNNEDVTMPNVSGE